MVGAEVAPQRPESPLRLVLACALLKGEKFDTVVQKATELGVVRIVPVASARADVRLREAGAGTARAARWQRLALEAAKQSGRACVPAVATPMSLGALLVDEELPGDGGARLLFTERGGRGLLETCGELNESPATLAALTGPEGGWADEELAQAEAAGWRLVTLGGRIMRAETAAVVGVALLQHLCGDLR